ncbi:hypothetical protein BGZ73_002713 [Actinomortierella ambigua]|nr:hypothetical protein BGZ73_002713 [Actinomortierella ambigua]
MVQQLMYSIPRARNWRGSRVAVKRFHASSRDFDQEEWGAIRKEIQILETLRFSRVVQFYCCVEYKGYQSLIMEYVDGGTLASAILKRRLGSGEEGWSNRTRIALEMAEGLAHIHEHGVIHRDLKSANVLLAYGVGVKLCDFGLAVIKTKSAASTYESDKFRGTLRWMAPELLRLRPRYSAASDMYAFGMVMWEMATNCTKPFKGQESNEVVANCVKAGEREDVPDNTPTDYARVIEQCWKQDPKERPTARWVEDTLREKNDESDAGSYMSEPTEEYVSITDSWDTLHLTKMQSGARQSSDQYWNGQSPSSQSDVIGSILDHYAAPNYSPVVHVKPVTQGLVTDFPKELQSSSKFKMASTNTASFATVDFAEHRVGWPPIYSLPSAPQHSSPLFTGSSMNHAVVPILKVTPSQGVGIISAVSGSSSAGSPERVPLATSSDADRLQARPTPRAPQLISPEDSFFSERIPPNRSSPLDTDSKDEPTRTSNMVNKPRPGAPQWVSNPQMPTVSATVTTEKEQPTVSGAATTEEQQPQASAKNPRASVNVFKGLGSTLLQILSRPNADSRHTPSAPQLIPPTLSRRIQSGTSTVEATRRDFQVVVGIEFGENFSSSVEGRDETVVDVSGWLVERPSSTKVANILLYNVDDHSSPLFSWGSRAKQDVHTLSSPALINNLRHRVGTQGVIHGPNLTGDVVLVDFFRALYNHMISEVQRHPGASVFLQAHQFRYCMTVPSAWQEEKRTKFRELAIRSGILTVSDPPERLVLVSEAEAIAEYCFRTTTGWTLRPSEQFLVCSLQEDRLEISALEHSSSSPMGRHSVVDSTQVSRHLGLERLEMNFKEFLKHNSYWLWQRMQPQYQDEVLQQFRQEIVPRYDGQGDIHLRLSNDIMATLPSGENIDFHRAHLEGGYLKLLAQDLRDYVLDPVVREMYDFVADNVPLQPHCMLFLVGQAIQPYIVQQMRRMLGVYGIEIVTPPQPDKAIVRGAVYVGLQQHTSERRSRWWFGVASNARSTRRRLGLRPLMEDDGPWELQPLIEKGTSIQPIVQHRFSFVYRVGGVMTDHSMGLYATAHGDTFPLHNREGHVQELVVVTIPCLFSKWPLRKKVEVTMAILFDEDTIDVLVMTDTLNRRVTIPYPK